MASYHPKNELITGSPYEDLTTVARVSNAEFEASIQFKNFFTESMQNFKRMAGYIYSAADLNKLELEKRPKFVYNFLLPIILQLMGNFLNNQSRVEASPRTMGDIKLTNIMTDVLDYIHYTANDLQGELSQAYGNAIIGRIGWIAQDWLTKKDSDGMMSIENYDPFRLMYDNTYVKRDLSTSKWVMDRGWYSPEEIRKIWAASKPDMYDEITDKAKMYLGTDPMKNDKLISYVERIWGVAQAYPGKDQGYDEVTRLVDGLLYNNQEYFDVNKGLFKVIEFHERRSDKLKAIYDADKNKWYDISKKIDLSPDGKSYDNDKLQAIRQQFQYPVIRDEIIEQIYVTSVCPAFNMKLFEAPYKVQNGNFKYTPIFCFDFGADSLDWKSYVDHIIDPVMSIVLRSNTLDTYMLKATVGERIVETDAFEDETQREDFNSNKIGQIKEVAPGGLGKIKDTQLPTIPQGIVQDVEMKKQMIKEIVGVQGNSMGQQQTSSENAKLFGYRVAQSDIMQNLIQDNAIAQLKMVGRNTIDNAQKFLGVNRAIQISRDETDPYWLQINEGDITKLFLDEDGNVSKEERIPGSINTGKFDIILSKAPFGEAAKQAEFQENVTLAQIIAKELGRPDLVDPETLIKASRVRDKDKWISFIQKREQEAQQQQQADAQKQGMAESMAFADKKADIEKKNLENQDKKNDLMVDEALKNIVGQAIS